MQKWSKILAPLKFRSTWILFIFTSGIPGFTICLYNTLLCSSQCVQKIIFIIFSPGLWRNLFLLSTLCFVYGEKALKLIWHCCVLCNRSQSGWATPPKVHDNMLSSSWTNCFILGRPVLSPVFCQPRCQSGSLSCWVYGEIISVWLKYWSGPLEGSGHRCDVHLVSPCINELPPWPHTQSRVDAGQGHFSHSFSCCFALHGSQVNYLFFILFLKVLLYL